MQKALAQFGFKPSLCSAVGRLLFVWISIFVALDPSFKDALAQDVPNLSYSAPIVITKGGTYTGNYRSSSTEVACVRVNTAEPVTLLGCTLAGPGHLIVAGQGANLTVRNCRGFGLEPTRPGPGRGHFLDAFRPARLQVEHNYLAHTTGIIVNRWDPNAPADAAHALSIRFNQGLDCDGRQRGNQLADAERHSFVQLNSVVARPYTDISFNQFLNEPELSAVEDNINLYNASGTPASPLRVHDNYVQGAYPLPATAARFTGSGLTTDGDGSALAPAFIEADHNQFVSTCNAAMNIAAGHDIRYHDNRLVTSAVLADGRRLNATYAATAIFNYYQLPGALFGRNQVTGNVIGYVKWGYQVPYPDRHDLSTGACPSCQGNESLPNPITLRTEQAEWQRWQQKLRDQHITLGPEDGNDTPTPPALPPPAAPPTGTNLLRNPSFEDDGQPTQTPSSWQTATGKKTIDYADYTETYPDAHAGRYHATHYRPEDYEVSTYQTLSGLSKGTYTLRAWIKSSGTQAVLTAQKFGGKDMQVTIPASPGQWTQVTLDNIQVNNGKCEVGFYSVAQGGQWLYFDDVEFFQQGTNTPPNQGPAVRLSTTANNNTAPVGAALTLTATATDSDGRVNKVEFYNGATKLGEDTNAPYQLSWTPTAAGTATLTARATDDDGTTTTSDPLTLTLTSPAAPAPTAPVAGNNLLRNPGFEDDRAAVQVPSGWLTWAGKNTSDNNDYTESYGGTHSGQYHATHYRPDNYEIYTYQVVTGLRTGTYTFRAWIKSGGTQGVLIAKNFGGQVMGLNLPASPDQWIQVTLDNIQVTNGQCEVGFYSWAGGGGQWLHFDDVEFFRQGSANANANVAAASTLTASATTADASLAGGDATATALAQPLSLYPNPANEQLTVAASFAGSGAADVSIFTVQGKLVGHYQPPVQAGTNQLIIPTTNLPMGTYLLKLRNGKTTSTKRFVVLH